MMEKCMAKSGVKCHKEEGPYVCDKEWCINCGFNPEEAKRRAAIPLTRGEDGLLRKHVGDGVGPNLTALEIKLSNHIREWAKTPWQERKVEE